MADPTFTAPPSAPSRSDAPATFVTRADAFVAWFATLYAELAAFVTWVNAQIAAISTTATTAVATITALASTAGFTGTSTTSVAIATGSKAFTTQTNRSFLPGSYVVIADSAAPNTNWMHGQVTSYNSGTGALVVEVSLIGGSGTKTAWNISLSSPRGATATFVGGTLTGRTDLAAFTEKQGPYSAGALDVSSATGGSVFDAAISANATISLSGLPGSPVTGQTVSALLRATVTGSPVLTFPAGIKWLAASVPVVTAGRMVFRIDASWSGSAWVYDGSWGVLA